ncbi:MAG: glycoside hydrolase N-terminal domain-containing protein [Clostridia bacterium]
MSFTSQLLSYKPSSTWEHCFPIGNGNLGLMQLGDLTKDVLFFNDDTFWSGNGEQHSYPTSNIAAARASVLAGELGKAQDEIWKSVLGDFTEGYLPLCELTINRKNINTKGYSRKLDFASATHFVTTASYRARSFVSAVDKICAYRVDCDKSAEHSFSASSKTVFETNLGENNDGIIATMQAPSHVDPAYLPSKNPIIYDQTKPGMTARVIIRVDTDGDKKAVAGALVVTNASYIELRVASVTSFTSSAPQTACEKIISDSLDKTFDELLARHSADFNALYSRSDFSLESSRSLDTIATAKILKKRKKNDALCVTLFNFGKYLMISASRKGTSCMNLQGIWNKDMRPGWSSNYTTNINTEMNYWGAESVNLSECHLPMLDLIRKISVNGKQSAKWQFGVDNGGWSLGQNSDIWGHSDAVGRNSDTDPASWGLFVGGGGWMASHLWLHYLYTKDKQFLQENYAILRDCAKFYLGYLTQDPDTNYLIACPSSSPENMFFHKGIGRAVNKCSTMDISIIEQIFSIVVEAAQIVEPTDPVAEQCKDALPRLYPLRIGSQGQLLEWYDEYAETAKHHRHTSHLYALHPYWKISPLSTPELAKACEKTLELRGCGGTGWSLAWKTNMYARLFDGDMALKLLRNQLRVVSASSPLSMSHGGSYENLLCAHPPFQIDGNFGAMSGISEMVLQSHHGIDILPALPQSWQNGSFSNFKAQGNYTVSCQWKKGKVTSLQINGEGNSLDILICNKPVTVKLNELVTF